MSSIDIISMALKNLFKRKLRTFLTVFGVIIGTTAIVTMLSLGIGINRSFEAQLEQMGDLTIITVQAPFDHWTSDETGNVTFIPARADLQLNDDAVAIFNDMEGVVLATGVAQMWMNFASGRYSMSTQVIGIEPRAMEILGYSLAEGAFLSDDNERPNHMDIVFGSNLRNSWRRGGDWRNPATDNVDLFTDRIGFHFRWDFMERGSGVRPYNANVLGVLEMEDGMRGSQTNNAIFMSLSNMRRLQADEVRSQREQGVRNATVNTGFERAYVKCTDIRSVEGVLTQIRDMGFEAFTPADFVSHMQSVAASLQFLLGAIGGVSLFIAAIGIANTMVMSIYERTKEIGVMKVIGASIQDIKKLFLLEAAIIGFWGGIFGIALSLGASYLINNVGIAFLDAFLPGQGDGQGISFVPMWLCLAALAFSTSIGLISGYFPARRAMKLSALNAIRTE